MKSPYKVDYEKELNKLSKKQLVKFADMVARKNFWLHQGNYMLALEEKYGQDIAMEFDRIVFGRTAEVQASRYKKFFNLGDGIEDFVKALIYSQVFSNVGWEIAEINDKRAIVRITDCTMQKARLKLGLPEIPCKSPLVVVMDKFAKAINPKLNTNVTVCPPDPHPADKWCETTVVLSA